MKKSISLPICLLVIIATSAAIRAQESGLGPRINWLTYTVKGEEFSVSLPKLPAMMTSEGVRKEDGKRRLERYLKTYDEGVDYIIETFENPEKRRSLEQFIAEEGLNARYDPDTKRSLTLDGFAGIEYSSSSDTSPGRMQIFVTEKHLYRFVATGPRARTQPLVGIFFSSIKLGKKLDGKEVSDGPGHSTPLLSDTGERVFTGREVDTKVRLLKKPEPVYTVEARKNKITGTVMLKAVFSHTGEVTNIHLVSGLPYGLTNQAIAAARKITFTPAMKDGKPVSMWIQLEYNFNR